MMNNNYIKEVEEYGQKQYMPGGYTGSDMPPMVKYHRNKSLKILTSVSLVGFIVYLGYLLLQILF